MAVTNVVEVIDQENQAERNDEGHLSFSRFFHVFTDSQYDGAQSAMLAATIPAHKESYSYGNEANIYALCVGVRPRRLGAYLWLVEALYSTDTQRTDDPINFDPIYSGDFDAEKEIIDVDVTGELIRNSAEDVFVNPAPTRDASVFNFSVEKNLAWNTFGKTQAVYYHNKINSADWGDFPQGSLRCRVRYSQQSVCKDGIFKYYWNTSWQFAFKYNGLDESGETYAPGWLLRLPNAGFNQFDFADPPNKVPIMVPDATGTLQFISSPWCLSGEDHPDGPGHALAKGESGNWLDFNQYYEVDFNSLPFGAPP